MLLFLLLSLATLAASSATCYYPSGKVADHIPCNRTTIGYSSCCESGDPCMSSGLCFNKGLVSRGSCTDATWKDGACAQSCIDWNANMGCPIIPHSWTATSGDVNTMGWCCGFPLANGSCPQGFEVSVQAGAVLEDATATSGKPASAHACQASHDVAVGLGVGIPTVIASISMLLLWLRERRARRKEKRKTVSLTSSKAPWMQLRSDGRSTTTITSDEPPWIKNRTEAPTTSRVPHIELEEIPWRRELP